MFANDVMTTQTGEIGIMRRLLTQLPPKKARRNAFATFFPPAGV